MTFDLTQLSGAGWFHALYFGIALPALAVCGRRKFTAKPSALPNRLAHFQRTTVMLLLCLVLSLIVARVESIELFPPRWPRPLTIVVAIGLYALAVAYMRPRWRRAVESGAPVVHLFCPSTPKEHVWWGLVSVSAGVGEEITWRGAQTGLLDALTGNFWVAAAVSAASFGCAHAVQGRRSAFVITLFAIAFQTLVWLDDSLYVAMAAHVVYDLTAGIMYARLAKRLDYAPRVEPEKVLTDSGTQSPSERGSSVFATPEGDHDVEDAS